MAEFTTEDLIREIDTTIGAMEGDDEFAEPRALQRVIRARVVAHDGLVEALKPLALAGEHFSDGIGRGPLLPREAFLWTPQNGLPDGSRGISLSDCLNARAALKAATDD